MTHTPSPWKHNRGQVFRSYNIEGVDRREAVCSVSLTADNTDESNARLIAAAPELLSALESALCNILSLGATEDWPQVQQYRSIISKARGEI